MTERRSSSALIHARRFDTRYVVPRAHPATDKLRLQLDQVAATSLRHAIVASLLHNVNPNSDEVVFIRRLDLSVSVNASWDTDRLARVWAAQVARSLTRCIESSGWDANVVRFENQSAYVRQFITDLVDDCAWSRWYYESFSGLKMLTPTAAIRTVIAENPLRGVDALAKLTPEKRSQVVAVLSTQDAQRILQIIPFAESRVNMRALLEAAWRAFERFPAAWDQSDDHKIALSICLEVAAHERATLDRSITVAALAIVRLMHIARRRPVLINPIKRVLQASNSAALYVLVSAGDAAALAPLAEGGEDWIEAVCTAITGSVSDGVTVYASECVVPRRTSFGGIFFLLPTLDSLSLSECVSEWRGVGDSSAESLVRLLIVSKALGGASVYRLANDSVVRDLLGVDPRISFASIVEWYTSLSKSNLIDLCRYVTGWLRDRELHRPYSAEYLQFPSSVNESPTASRSFGLAAYAVLAALSKKLPGFSQSSFTHIRVNFLECSASVDYDAGRYVAHLSRAPLDLILNMTGLSRTSYRLSWLAEHVAVCSDGAV